MKTLHTALLASTFLCVTYVAVPGSASAGSTWFTQTSTIEPSRVEKNTNDATDLTIDVAETGQPVIDEVEGMKTALDTEELSRFGFPDACVIQTLLNEELGDLYQRARDFRAHMAEVRHTQFQIVLGRYERAVLEIQKAWKNGELAEDIAIKAMATMRIDAFDYLQSLGVTEIRARLNEAIAELIARGQDAMDRADAERDTFKKLYELRLDAAWVVFKARLENGAWTKFDLKRIQDAVRALENLTLFGKPYECDI